VDEFNSTEFHLFRNFARSVDLVNHLCEVLFDCLPVALVELDTDSVWSWGFVSGHCFDYCVEFLFADWIADK